MWRAVFPPYRTVPYMSTPSLAPRTNHGHCQLDLALVTDLKRAVRSTTSPNHDDRCVCVCSNSVLGVWSFGAWSWCAVLLARSSAEQHIATTRHILRTIFAPSSTALTPKTATNQTAGTPRQVRRQKRCWTGLNCWPSTCTTQAHSRLERTFEEGVAQSSPHGTFARDAPPSVSPATVQQSTQSP